MQPDPAGRAQAPADYGNADFVQLPWYSLGIEGLKHISPQEQLGLLLIGVVDSPCLLKYSMSELALELCREMPL